MLRRFFLARIFCAIRQIDRDVGSVTYENTLRSPPRSNLSLASKSTSRALACIFSVTAPSKVTTYKPSPSRRRWREATDEDADKSITLPYAVKSAAQVSLLQVGEGGAGGDG